MNTNSSETEQLIDTLMQLGKLMSQHAHEPNEDKSATMLQVFTLRYIKQHPNATVGDLAHVLHLSKSSATQLVERLVTLGFIERVGDRKDRRIIRLSITQEGEKEFIILKKKKIEKMKKILSKVPPEDIKELIRIHTNLLEQLRKENLSK